MMLTFSLLLLLIVIIFIGIIAFLIRHTNQRNLANAKPREKSILKEKPVYIEENPLPQQRHAKKHFPPRLPVHHKKRFFTKSEQQFYTLLLSTLSHKRFRIFPNVRLPDLIKVDEHIQKKEMFDIQNLYYLMHVDFLIVSVPDFQPVLALELDGPSHDHPKQKNLDQGKEMIFRSANLPLMRFKNEDELSINELRAHFKPYLDL